MNERKIMAAEVEWIRKVEQDEGRRTSLSCFIHSSTGSTDFIPGATGSYSSVKEMTWSSSYFTR